MRSGAVSENILLQSVGFYKIRSSPSYNSSVLVVMSVTISAQKRCSVRLYLQLFAGELMSYLRYLCLILRSDVQHILCCVFAFVCLFFVSLCTLCCQFLWFVHF